MDHDARRLVDDQQVIVLVYDVKRHALSGARIRRARHFGQLDGDRFAGLDDVSLLPGLAVDGDRAALDQPLRGRTRSHRVKSPEELVEPFSSGVGRDDDFQRFTSAT